MITVLVFGLENVFIVGSCPYKVHCIKDCRKEKKNHNQMNAMINGRMIDLQRKQFNIYYIIFLKKSLTSVHAFKGSKGTLSIIV